MGNLLQGMPHVSIYLDDILVTGTSEVDHLKTLDEVLSRLKTAELRLKQNKGGFLLLLVDYVRTWDIEFLLRACNPQMKRFEPLRRLHHQVTCLNYVHLLDW